MLEARPRGAVHFVPEWFSILPDEDAARKRVEHCRVFWAPGLLAVQKALRDSSSSEETRSEGHMRDLLVEKVAAEISETMLLPCTKLFDSVSVTMMPLALRLMTSASNLYS